MILLLVSFILISLPDIIIVQVIDFLFWPSTHLTNILFLSVVIVKLKYVASPGLLILTRAATNPIFRTFCLEVTVHMLSDGEEYHQAATVILSVIVWGFSSCLWATFMIATQTCDIYNKTPYISKLK